MERVAFLIESTGERLGCMLNPESLVMRRLAGIRPRRSAGGAVTGAGLADDPLLFTGGGTTELRLDLLFDVTLAGSSIATQDVRQLTAPLWNLAENSTGGEAARPPKVRFVWGKNWNIPGIVSSVAERLEYFSPEGLPRRSWLRLSLLRAADPPPPPAAEPEPVLDAEGAEPVPELQVAADDVAEGDVLVHEVTGGEGGTSGAEEGVVRWDLLAWRYFQDCSLWKLLAEFNGIDDPGGLRAGQTLRIPPPSAMGGRP